MNGLIHSSLYFGMLVSVGAYMLGVWLKKKTGWAILNPLLVAIIVVIAFLSVFHIEYKEYNRGAVYLGYFLTPATVCLAIPLYKQLELLRQHLIAVASAIVAGVAGSVGSIYLLVNTVIYLLCFLIYDSQVALYSIVHSCILSFVLDRIHEDNAESAALIITENHELKQQLILDVGRGVTVWDGTGGYSGRRKEVMMVAITRGQYGHLEKNGTGL